MFVPKPLHQNSSLSLPRKPTPRISCSSFFKTSHGSSLRHARMSSKSSTTFYGGKLALAGRLSNISLGNQRLSSLLCLATRTRRSHSTRGWCSKRCYGMNSLARYCYTPNSTRNLSSTLPLIHLAQVLQVSSLHRKHNVWNLVRCLRQPEGNSHAPQANGGRLSGQEL